MRSLTNRLRLTWLTVVAVVAFVVVGLVGPDNVGMARVAFAGNTTDLRGLLSLQGEHTIRFETVSLLRAQFAADMLFLVAYGLLLRASIRILPSVPLARFALHGPLVVMIADAVENLFALSILRRVGEDTCSPRWWFVTMNLSAGAKWLAAAVVLLCLAIGWRREATKACSHGWLSWLMAEAFCLGGLASLAVAGFGLAGFVARNPAFAPPNWLVTTALLGPAVALLLQLRLLETGTLMLRFLSLSRAPLVVLLLLAAFGPVALGPAVALLGGIMVAGNITGIAVTTAASLALLFACGTQINIVRAYAWARVQDQSLDVLHEEVLARCVFWTGVAAAASLLFSVSLVSLSLTIWRIAVGILAGGIVMLVFLFLIELIAAYLSVTSPGHPPPELAVPFRRIPALDMLLTAATGASPPAWKQYFAGRFVTSLFESGNGYVETLPSGQRRLLPGHSFATVQFVLTFVVFWFGLYAKSLPGAPTFQVPTVTSFVLLFLLSSWALAAAAFFFDRYRVPLFTVAVAAALITGSLSRTDYRVPTQVAGDKYTLATPGQVLHAFGEKPLVVAAAGGGIQAGAWTAQVLAGLDGGPQRKLRDRVALVSSVSGGSMGALYYGAFQDQPTLERAAEQALEPSLDEVTTAFVRRDIFEVGGLRVGPDRGAALEESWERRLGDVPKSSVTMRSWSEAAADFAGGVGQHRPFPAFLFNSTIVESGQPIVFATTQFPTPSYKIAIGMTASHYPTLESANSIFGLSVVPDKAIDIGLKAVTAARISAAFPYVSPAVRLENREPYHLVDGGYYDFYGLVALSQWVDNALEELHVAHQLPKTLGVIIARGLVSSDTALRDNDAANPIALKAAPRGWRWQLTAPPATVVNAQSFAQWAGSMQTLRLLIEKWAARQVKIIPVLFDYPGGEHKAVCQGAPLSWKLTEPQRTCISSAWHSFVPNDTVNPLPEDLR